MKPQNPKPLALSGGVIHYGYLLALFFITLSGFAQIPIFKRYYIADIPGLGWLAQFYVTHIIHYLSAALLLGISAYRISEYLLQRRKTLNLTPSGYWRGGLILALMVTGILLVIRNFEGHLYSDNFVIGLVLTHLSLMVIFLLTVLFCVIFSSKIGSDGSEAYFRSKYSEGLLSICKGRSRFEDLNQLPGHGPDRGSANVKH
jgi:hypothetical protein